MRVIPSAPPVERTTTVELTDRDIQFIERGLFVDGLNDDENQRVFDEFHRLRLSLNLVRPADLKANDARKQVRKYDGNTE